MTVRSRSVRLSTPKHFNSPRSLHTWSTKLSSNSFCGAYASLHSSIAGLGWCSITYLQMLQINETIAIDVYHRLCLPQTFQRINPKWHEKRGLRELHRIDQTPNDHQNATQQHGHHNFNYHLHFVSPLQQIVFPHQQQEFVEISSGRRWWTIIRVQHLHLTCIHIKHTGMIG